jgi:hypothetical protein
MPDSTTAYSVELPLEAYEQVEEARFQFREGLLPTEEHDERIRAIISRYGRLPLPGEVLYVVLAHPARTFGG